MPTPLAKLGLKCTMSLNGGSFASPTWTEVKCVSDFALKAAWDKGEANSRETRIKLALKTMLDLGFTGKLRSTNSGDTNYATIYAALLTDTALDLMILNGPSTQNGVTGFRVSCQVFSANEDQGLGVVVYDEIEFAPTPNADGNYSSVLVTSGSPVFTQF